jgi:bla regulator protein blaR1
MAGGATLAALAQQLSRIVGGIVEDKTGLGGQFDYTLTYAPDPGLGGRSDLPGPPGGGAPTAGSDAPSIFSAVQEQLGLKLDSTKGPVDVLVIDSAERPSED